MLRNNIKLLREGEALYIDKMYRNDYQGAVSLQAGSTSALLTFSSTDKVSIARRFNILSNASPVVFMKGDWDIEIPRRKPVDGGHVRLLATFTENTYQVMIKISDPNFRANHLSTHHLNCYLPA
jgi:hypothetical protein